MNYALGRTEPTCTSAMPVLLICGTTFTLTRNIRNDDSSLSAFGQYPFDLNGLWSNVGLTDTGATTTVDNTTVKTSFSDIGVWKAEKVYAVPGKQVVLGHAQTRGFCRHS